MIGRKMARRDADKAKLRHLAGQLDYTVERAPITDTWFLVDAKGQRAVSERGTTGFSTKRAIAFLQKVLQGQRTD